MLVKNKTKLINVFSIIKWETMSMKNEKDSPEQIIKANIDYKFDVF